jgi:hypothetical protein
MALLIKDFFELGLRIDVVCDSVGNTSAGELKV